MKLGSMKSPGRSVYKFLYLYDADPRKLTDILRVSFVFKSLEDLYRAVAVFNKDYEIKAVQDNFCQSYSKSGYRDLKLLVVIPGSESGMIGEIQLHIHEIFKAK